MRKKGVNLFFIFFFFFASITYSAEVCGWRTYLDITNPGELCPSSALALSSTQLATYGIGCSQSESISGDCVTQYKICCTDTTKSYEDAVTFKNTTTVNVGTEQDVAMALYERVKADIVSPSCASGYSKTADLLGFVSDIKSSSSNYMKSDVTVTSWGRVGCSKFTNSTTVVLNPVQTGGGSTAESLVELQKVNTALTSIKGILDSIETTGQASNPLLTDIKTLLQDGLDFNSAALETGINQVGVNTASSNDILNAINTKLTKDCTTTWDPNGGTCSWVDSDRNPSTPDIQICSGADVTNCEGIDVSDSAALGKLQEIKDLLASGTGGTVNADMTETNSILTDIKNFLTGASSLVPYTDESASKTAYSYSDFITTVPTVTNYKDEFNTFVTNMKSTPLYGLLGSFFNSVPIQGTSIISFNGGKYGHHTFDFATWSSVFLVLKALVLIIFASLSLKIIFLKGGSG